MEDALRSNRLCQITLGKKQEPNDDESKFKWDNKSDESHGLI
jgi:hypothetical protein